MPHTYIILVIIVMATLTRCFVIITKVCFNKWFWRTSSIMQNIYITPGTKRVWVIFCVTCTHFGRQWSTSLVNYLNMATQLKSVGWYYVNPISINSFTWISQYSNVYEMEKMFLKQRNFFSVQAEIWSVSFIFYFNRIMFIYERIKLF